MDTKKRRLSIKLTQRILIKSTEKPKQANKNITDYVTTTCLGKEIVIITDLAEGVKGAESCGQKPQFRLPYWLTAIEYGCQSCRCAGGNGHHQQPTQRYFRA